MLHGLVVLRYVRRPPADMLRTAPLGVMNLLRTNPAMTAIPLRTSALAGTTAFAPSVTGNAISGITFSQFVYDAAVLALAISVIVAFENAYIELLKSFVPGQKKS
jgi:hypothetical protein